MNKTGHDVPTLHDIQFTFMSIRLKKVVSVILFQNKTFFIVIEKQFTV